MKVKRVCCQGCGADLQVDETVRFVTCNYCHARLEIVHDSTVTHSRLLEDLGRSTRRMEGNLRVIELQNDLERLDREWEHRRQSLMIRNKDGHPHVPTQAGAVAGGVFAVIAGVVFFGFSTTFHGPVVLFALAFIVFVMFSLFRGVSKASAYRDAEADFSQRRSDLARRIERARRDG